MSSIPSKFRSYLRPTRSKLLLWFSFLTFYIISSLAYLGILPNSWYRFFSVQIYSVSRHLDSPESFGSYSFTGNSSVVDATTLFIAYALLTYLFSCIFVESFGTISPSRKRKPR